MTVFRRALVAVSVVVLSACAQGVDKDRAKVSRNVDVAVTKTEAGLGDALLSPAEDLNLKRAEIPPVLERLNSVYVVSSIPGCKAIGVEIANLTAVLGPDEDEKIDEDETGKAGRQAADATLDAVSGATSGVIPFRGLVRQVTGASAHEKKVRASILRGLQRRSYLKGLGQAQGCAPPAAPKTPEPESSKIVYRETES